MLPTIRTLKESDIYTDQFSKLGDARRLDEVLRGILNSIASNAESWPSVTGYQITRMAKTSGYGNTPIIRVRFQIESANQVLLVGIELDKDDQTDGG